MEKIQLNGALAKYNQIYGTDEFTADNNYFNLVTLIMALLDIDNKTEAAKLINSFCLEIPDGKTFLIIIALAYDHVKFFNLINELFNIDIDNDFIYKIMKSKSSKIITNIRTNSSDYNINISLDNYMGIQKCIIDFDDKEYLPVFTEIMRLFNERSKILSYDKVSLVYNCFIKDAVIYKKWFFLAIIVSYYAEECNRELNNDDQARIAAKGILYDDLFSIIPEDERLTYLEKIKKISVLKDFLNLK